MVISLKRWHTGVDGCWCTPRSSKPVIGVNSFLGGFDSHVRPPHFSAGHGNISVPFFLLSDKPQVFQEDLGAYQDKYDSAPSFGIYLVGRTDPGTQIHSES